jgi:hypothetical protein
MATQLDVYRDWLEIAETARPLNHYQLLKLKLFEDDPAAVRASYRKLNAHVRKYSSGEFGPQSQALLNELCQAMLCLTDAVRKSEYDASLGRAAAAGAGKAKTFEEVLVGRKVLTGEQLDKARRFSKTIGVEVRDAILQQRLAPAEQVMQVYAESIGLPFVELGDVEVDEELVPKVPAVTARQQSCAPLMAVDGRVLMLAPHLLPPEIEDLLRLRFGVPVRLVMCTPGDINRLITKYYSKEAAKAELASGPPKIASSPRAEAAAVDQPAAAPATAPAASTMSYQERTEAKKKRLINAVLIANVVTIVLMLGISMSTNYMVRAGWLLGGLVGLGFWIVAFAIIYVLGELKGP